MSLKIVSRSKWGAAPPKGKTLRPVNTLDGVAIHWFGSPKAAKSHDGCPALLRSVQAGHLANTKEGYVDIAYCVDSETEALTSLGWKRYDELRVGDIILTLDHETGDAEWQPVEAMNIFPAATRELVAIEANGHSSLTTTNHRWPVERYRRVTGTARVHGPDGRFAPTGRASPTVKERVRVFTTSGALTCWDRFTTAAPVSNLPTVPVYDNDFVELVAWTWAEGHVARSRGKLTTGITIYQSHVANPQLVERIRRCLTSLYGPPLESLRKHTALPAWREYLNGHKTEFRLNHVAGRQVLEVMTSPDKVVSPRFVASLTESQLRRFVDVSVLADGWRSGPTAIVGQAIRERLDSLQMAGALLGLRTRLAVADERGKTRYDLRLSESARSRSFWPHRARPRRVEHEGIVWCPTTANGTWLARRRGTVYFTGNSHAVCPHGTAYELRGFGVQTGANGTSAANRSHAAIVYMAGEGDTFTAEARATLAELIRLWQSKGAGLDVKPHGFFVGTTCPGPDVRRWIEQKGWKKEPKTKDATTVDVRPSKDDVQPWLTAFLEWRLVEGGAPRRKPKGLPAKIPESAWQTVTELQRLVDLLGPQQPFLDWAEWRLGGSKKADRPRSLPAAIPKPWPAAFERIKAMTAGPAPTPEPPAPKPKPAEKLSASSALLAAPRAERAQLEARILARPHGSYSDANVRSIVREYDQAARSVGLDPLLVVAQMVLETGNLTSEWSQPPRRNPAGIGVTGEPGKGVLFPSWKKAVRAHCGRVLAYALPKGAESAEQKALIEEALAWRPLPDSFRGVAPTLSGLTGKWATDPQYADKIVRVAGELSR